MAALRISSAKPQRTYWGFTTALASAVLEWLLMLFMFVNAILSFLVTKFARCCKLQTPCLLCSRLDHVFGSEKLGYYWELICGNHKLEISSLVLCHSHNKLVDVQGMCETCLFSFATFNKSNAETYRLLVGKLGEDTLCGFDQDPLLDGHEICCSSARHCSCCSEPWVLRRDTQKLIQTKSVECEDAELDVPSSGEVGLNQDDWKMRIEKPSVSVRTTNLRNSGIDSLSHVGYSELKATSDTESEVLYSDDDDASALLRATGVSNDDLSVQGVQLEPLISTLADDYTTEKLIIADFEPEASTPVSRVQLDSIEVHGSTSVASTGAVKNGLEELMEPLIITQANDLAPEKLIMADSEPEAFPSVSQVQLDSIEVHGSTSVASIAAVKNGLEELMEPFIISQTDDSATSSLVSHVQLDSIEVHGTTSVASSTANGREEFTEPLIITQGDDLVTKKLIISDSAPEVSSSVSQVPLDSIEVHGSTSVALTSAVKNGLEKLMEPLIMTQDDDSATEKLIIADSVPEVSSSVSQLQLDSIEVHGSTSVASTAAVNDGLEELSWQRANIKLSSPAPTEAYSKANSTAPTDIISLDYVTPSSNTMETTIEVSKESYLSRTSDVGQTSMVECGKINDARTLQVMSSEIGLETKPTQIDMAQLVPNSLDLGDAYKIAVGSRGRQSPVVLVEQWVGKDNSRVSEDLKLLLSQLSATRGFEQVMNDKSPRVSVNGDESKTIDASNSSGIQMLQKRISLEKNESVLLLDGSAVQKRISLERNESGLSLDGRTLQKRISLERNESGLSLDGSIVSEIEGESMIDRLKRQIEHDKKHMSALNKELEEERNASADAVNQAMAMITKLQEEKATLHMEALQCLRLMEEQSEYDMEALQKANDLLAEREKEMQDLEDELEFYRNKFPNESILENVVEETCDVKARDIGMDHCESVCVEDSASVLRDSITEKLNIYGKAEGTGMPLGDTDTGSVKNALLEFEDDRLYILQCLKKLEKKLYLFSNNGEFLANGEYHMSEGDGKSEFKESNLKGGTEENPAVEEDDLSMQNDISVSRTNLHAQFSFEKSQPICKENIEVDSSGQGSPVLHRGPNLASIGNEVSDLNGRLEALEADRIFLEHAINSVRNGEEGLQLVREVASHLQELRRIGIGRIDPTTA